VSPEMEICLDAVCFASIEGYFGHEKISRCEFHFPAKKITQEFFRLVFMWFRKKPLCHNACINNLLHELSFTIRADQWIAFRQYPFFDLD
jgi:hypothetical protein